MNLSEFKKFELQDGKVAVQAFGKYAPDLCIITTPWPERENPWTGDEDENARIIKSNEKSCGHKMSPEEISSLNVGAPNCRLFVGEFFVSKKGTKCFRIEEGGHDWLLWEEWGGAFCDNRGNHLTLLSCIKYQKRASSNGGGCGTDYVIVPEGTTRILTEDDL